MFEKQINEEKFKIAKLEKATNQAYNDAQKAEDIFNAEMDGRAGARGYGDEAKKKEEAKNRYWNAYNGNKKRNDDQISISNERIKSLNKEKEEKYKQAEKEVDALDGLLERIKLAHKIAGFWISLFITLLFMVIELTPIFFKMMLIKGPYDYMDDNIKDLARAEAGIEVIYNYYEDKKGMEAHKVVNHAAELKQKERLLIIKAQEELNEQIIDKWKKKKSDDIDNNPDDFISES